MKAINTFTEVLNTDLSDFIIKNTMVRLGMNIRIVDLESSTYAISNLKGTETAFTLTTGYVPIAVKQFDNVLYILSIKPADSTCELGTFGSPDYTGGVGSQELYRPLNNLDNGPFRTTVFGYGLTSFVKIELQPEYDGSINIIMFEKNNPPRLVNSKIRRSNIGALEVAPNRPGNASSNDYTAVTVAEESKLIITSSKILKLSLDSIATGGRLKYGSYIYYFAYMTEDFNTTEIIGQSSLCAVFTGVDMNTLRGGNSSQETDKRVAIALSNIDQTFKYIKVFFLYSSGVEGLEQQMFEFTTPTEITDTIMTFYHTGFEEVSEVSQDVVNTNFQAIDAAATGAQNNGYLIAGGVKTQSIDFTPFKNAAANVQGSASSGALAYSGSLSTLEGYADYRKIYDALGYMGGETYPFRMCFVLPGGKVTPPFPLKGIDYATGGTPTNNDGLIRIPKVGTNPFYDGVNIYPRHVNFDLSSIPGPVMASSVGFFFVRGERRPNLLAQGYLVPTLRAPAVEFYDSSSTYYNRFQGLVNAPAYKLVPCVDNMLEAFERDTASGGGDVYTVDITNGNRLNQYLPIFIQHFGPVAVNPGGATPNLAAYIENYPNESWAFISADDFGNEPALTSLIAQRSGMQCHQVGKVAMKVKGIITPVIPLGGTADAGANIINTGLLYDTSNISFYGSPATPTVDVCEYVPAESFTTGSGFASKIGTRFQISAGVAYGVSLGFNSYFGMKMVGLADNTYAAGNPRAGNQRLTPGAPYYKAGFETTGNAYSNYDTTVNAAFLANIYPQGGLLPVNSLYPDTDSLIYKQVGQRYEWSDVGSSVTVYGGDCYITKSFRKLYQSTKRDPLSPVTNTNIDSGMVISIFQESKYNTYLRNPARYDASETEDRSFYPYQSKGDFNVYRRYRYPESLQISPGYSPGLGSKSYIPVSSLAPFIETNFFSRLANSARHIPNAFANGYRLFTGNNFRDYDPSMGRIVDLQSFRDMLTIIFEHGIAAINVESRILTGKDASGPVFAQPSDVLPPNAGIFSRQLGSQHGAGVFQTPSAVYGMDVDKKKIWQLRDQVKAISDEQVASFLNTNPMTNPRIGYNFKYNEVVFTTDNWTLCFREGLERFTSFYSFKPAIYASRGAEFFSFSPMSGAPVFHRHDAPTRLIYGESQDCYIEFTVNNEVTSTKVHDYIEIFSNEVAPQKVEFFTYQYSSPRQFTINSAACGQYSHVNNAADFFLEVSPIVFRDKRFIVQIPNTEIYNGVLDKWNIGGRMRNKYLIVRLTYNTDQALQLMTVLTTFRHSPS